MRPRQPIGWAWGGGATIQLHMHTSVILSLTVECTKDGTRIHTPPLLIHVRSTSQILQIRAKSQQPPVPAKATPAGVFLILRLGPSLRFLPTPLLRTALLRLHGCLQRFVRHTATGSVPFHFAPIAVYTAPVTITVYPAPNAPIAPIAPIAVCPISEHGMEEEEHVPHWVGGQHV